MCDPVSIGIASIGLTAGSTVASYVSQKHTTQEQNDANDKFVAANKQAAIDAAIYNESELTLRQSEEVLAASATIHDLQKESDASQSTALVAASEAGVSGHSLDAVVADIQAKAGVNKVRTKENLSMREDQLQREKQGVLVDAQNNINTVRQTVVRGPSMLTPLFATGAAAVSTYDQYLDRQSRARAGNGGNS